MTHTPASPVDRVIVRRHRDGIATTLTDAAPERIDAAPMRADAASAGTDATAGRARRDGPTATLGSAP